MRSCRKASDLNGGLKQIPSIWVWVSHEGTAVFGPWFHLPGFHFGYLFLTHTHFMPCFPGDLVAFWPNGFPAISDGSRGLSIAVAVTASLALKAAAAGSSDWHESSKALPQQKFEPEPTACCSCCCQGQHLWHGCILQHTQDQYTKAKTTVENRTQRKFGPCISCPRPKERQAKRDKEIGLPA